jgi:activating signal cointegrator 1
MIHPRPLFDAGTAEAHRTTTALHALSLTQPWASLVAIGAKLVETRSWWTSYRGPLAIHASKGFPGWAKDCWQYGPHFQYALKPLGIETRKDLDLLPRGAIIATCRLVDCLAMYNPRVAELARPYTAERAFGDYSAGRWAWVLMDITPLPEPIECNGALGLWRVPDPIAARIGAPKEVSAP